MRGNKYVRFSKDWTEKELENLLELSPFKVLKTFIIPHGTMKKWSGIFKKVINNFLHFVLIFWALHSH